MAIIATTQTHEQVLGREKSKTLNLLPNLVDSSTAYKQNGRCKGLIKPNMLYPFTLAFEQGTLRFCLSLSGLASHTNSLTVACSSCLCVLLTSSSYVNFICRRKNKNENPLSFKLLILFQVTVLLSLCLSFSLSRK